MPRSKKSTRSSRSQRTKTVPAPALSKAYESELSYETRVIVVILLLLFVYPIGLICMWGWMQNWPIWLKLLISLPFFFGVLAFFAVMMALGNFIGHTRWDDRYEHMKRQLLITPTPMTVTVTPLPTNTGSSQTY